MNEYVSAELVETMPSANSAAAVESRAHYATDGTTRTGAQLAIQRG